MTLQCLGPLYKLHSAFCYAVNIFKMEKKKEICLQAEKKMYLAIFAIQIPNFSFNLYFINA